MFAKKRIQMIQRVCSENSAVRGGDADGEDHVMKKKGEKKKRETEKTKDCVSPRASCRYFCPTSLRYSSMALVASVFSRKMRCSFSPQRSTSDIIRSVRKSCR